MQGLKSASSGVTRVFGALGQKVRPPAPKKSSRESVLFGHIYRRDRGCAEPPITLQVYDFHIKVRICVLAISRGLFHLPPYLDPTGGMASDQIYLPRPRAFRDSTCTSSSTL